MTIAPALPPEITIEEIEGHLDRLALAITATETGAKCVPLYEWLEHQLDQRRRETATMSSVLERVRRSTDRKAARS